MSNTINFKSTYRTYQESPYFVFINFKELLIFFLILNNYFMFYISITEI